METDFNPLSYTEATSEPMIDDGQGGLESTSEFAAKLKGEQDAVRGRNDTVPVATDGDKSEDDRAEEVPGEPETSDGDDPKEPKEEEPAPDPEDKADKFAKAFEKLTLKEAKLRAEKAELAKGYQYVQEAQQQLKVINDWRAKLENDPASALDEIGITPEQIISLMQGKPKPDPRLSEIEARAEARIRALEARLEQQEQERQQQHTVRMAESWDRDYAQALQSPEYRIVREWDGAEDWGREMNVKNFHETGKFLTPVHTLRIIKQELDRRLEKLGFSGQSNNPATVKPGMAPGKMSVGPKSISPTLGVSSGSRNFSSEEEELAHVVAQFSSGQR